MGANGAGEEQDPSFSMGSGTPGTVRHGGTRYRVPMTGKRGLTDITVLVVTYTQGESSISVTGPRKRPSFPGLKQATVVIMLSFWKIPLYWG